MNDLARHIETLLLENDCVIVPDLGGFVAHYTPATCVEEENTFYPPMRVIGFNPQLKMNDGLLVQSYMSVYGTNFSDATRIVDKKVGELIACLHENGKAVLPNVGEIHYTIHGTYDFVPYDNRVTSPSLYGLDSFEMKPLAALQRKPAVVSRMSHPVVGALRERRARSIVRRSRTRLSNAIAMIAAVVVLFFLFSTPIENTEVVQGNYARMIPEELFEQIGKSSLTFNPVKEERTSAAKAALVQDKQLGKAVATSNTAKKARKEVKAVTMREVKVNELKQTPSETKKVEEKAEVKPAPAPVVKEIKKPYHIIVASMATEKDAQDMAGELKRKGYAGATAVIGGGKMRVSIESFATQAEAYQSLQVVRQTKGYESAWVLKY